MFNKLLNSFLKEHDGEDDLVPKVEPEKKPEIKANFNWLTLVLVLLIFVIAFVTRAYVLFRVTDPQNAGAEVWYSDVYHHWQIAYLTKEIGVHQGFLRLWDLKGMEYFWGLGHPLISMLLMTITGSSNILVTRLLSVGMGSLGLVFLFLIVKRSWGTVAGLGVALIGIANPVGMFSDASGMTEPLGIAMMLGGIYFFPRFPILTGLMLVYASITRAEYWLLSLVVLFGMLIVKTASEKKPALLVSYFIPILLYMKYLLDWTGNVIYPIWWNFLGNAAGKWQAAILPSGEQLAIQKVYWVIVGISLIGMLITLWKKPKETALLFFGFGNWLIWGVIIGMSSYLLSYLPRFWVDRIMLWPYLFVAVLIAVFFLHTLPNIFRIKILQILISIIGIIVVIIIASASQLLWTPINYYYEPSRKHWDNIRLIADVFGASDTKKGKVLVPEDWPDYIYMLVNYEGVSGKRIVGQMYDPFYYMGDINEVYDNWGENRSRIKDFFQKENITYLIYKEGRERYEMLLKKEPTWFTLIKKIDKISYYRVHVN